jgi:phosphate transport system permease protein
MTDISPTPRTSLRDIVSANVKKRYAAERRFKAFGIAMVSIAILACGVLLASILTQAIPALSENRLHLKVDVTAARADPAGNRDPTQIRQQGNFYGLVQDALMARFPTAEADGTQRDLFEIATFLAATPIGQQVAANPNVIGQQLDVSLPVNDDLDLFLKGAFGKTVVTKGQGALVAVAQADKSFVLSGAGPIFASIAGPGGRGQTFGPDKPSVFVETPSGTYKLTTVSPTQATATLLVRPKAGEPADQWSLVQIAQPEATRTINDQVIAYGRHLAADGAIKSSLNTTIFTNSDSNDAELAGLLSAFVGSLLTLAVTLVLAVPIGVATAVYLEEFAPKNRLTDFIEVNINNLAAVPSIVFGLLGFAVFLTFFGMPRSAPLVGGIVLALMSLPVIIIASRAALKAVPPSIREAALGVGASKMQTTFHHVLPLALPGIMTGSILAMAHALGETAPLLMIGMVAFIADVPGSLTDSATVLPVEIFMWAGRPERAWEPRTALAIILLLIFMIIMNGLAIYLRRKFERRW